MTDYRNGEIHIWNGGRCPVHPEDGVAVWFRQGGKGEGTSDMFSWWNNQGGGDIIAFQVIKKHEEPLTIWVNVYSDGGVESYDSQADAEDCSSVNCVRIAVKLQEVKE